jgi:transglutaminase-like putative cysteine protease
MARNEALARLDAEELAECAEAAGCRVLGRSMLDDGEEVWPVFELDCGDNARAIRFLDRAADLDAGRAEVRDLALRLRAEHPTAMEFGKAVQAFVKSAVAFVREVRETFQNTLYTLRRRAGDCDDHARAVVALTRAAGHVAHLVGVKNGRGRIAHVAPLVHDGRAWRWAETTVDAFFGEHPRAAALRLGVANRRPDLWSTRRARPASARP